MLFSVCWKWKILAETDRNGQYHSTIIVYVYVKKLPVRTGDVCFVLNKQATCKTLGRGRKILDPKFGFQVRIQFKIMLYHYYQHGWVAQHDPRRVEPFTNRRRWLGLAVVVLPCLVPGALRRGRPGRSQAHEFHGANVLRWIYNVAPKIDRFIAGYWGFILYIYIIYIYTQYAVITSGETATLYDIFSKIHTMVGLITPLQWPWYQTWLENPCTSSLCFPLKYKKMKPFI